MDMFKLIGIFILCTILTSCGNDSQNSNSPPVLSSLIELSENENNGFMSILEFYGGHCIHSKGVSLSTRDGGQKYFGIILSESSTLDDTALPLKIIASNVAYLFYQELVEERVNYDYVEVTLKQTDKEAAIFEVNLDDLSILEQKQKSLVLVEELTAKQEYGQLLELFPKNAEIRSLNKEKVINNLLAVDSIYGKVNEPILLVGFEIYFHRSYDERIRLYCIQRRTKRNLTYKLDLAKSIDSEKMYNFDYSY